MRDFNFESRETVPPLPDAIPTDETATDVSREALREDERAGDVTARGAGRTASVARIPFPRFRRLRGGCYLLRLTPRNRLPFIHYDGTLRVERNGFFNVTASGDLYIDRLRWPFTSSSEPSPTRIPIFPRDDYRYYLRVTQILEGFTTANRFTLGYELYRFDQSSNNWSLEGDFTADMAWSSPPSGYPSGIDFLSGEVKNANGTVVATLTMAWVSSYLRRAVVEIDRVKQSELPETSGYEDADGTDIDWRHVFSRIGWNVTVVESDQTLAEPSGEGWSQSELHAKMLDRRDNSDLDGEWRYHLLCVRQLDATSRGIMYDAYGGDSNNIPREGAAISSHWTIPDTNQWGNVAGQRFGAATAPYFRTAVHEIGHAMGLYHNTADNGFMNTTGVVASSGTTADPFPDNVQWAFNPDDEKRLRHMPDPWVRPGMIPFGSSYSVAPISPDDAVAEVDDLALNVSATLDSIPIGAPGRVDIELVNTSKDLTIPVPASLSLKAGCIHGRVTDPAGTVRDFWPMLRCIDDDEVEDLAPQASKRHSMTLVRGPQGALFPLPGVYTLEVRAEWTIDGQQVAVTGRTNLMVTPAVDEAHAAAALKLLSTPDVLPALVVGGDHLTDGVEAMQAALDNPVLRPHYCVIEAKRLSRMGVDLKKAAALIDGDTVVTDSEAESFREIVKPSAKAKSYKDLISKTERTLQKRVAEIRDKKKAAVKAK